MELRQVCPEFENSPSRTKSRKGESVPDFTWLEQVRKGAADSLTLVGQKKLGRGEAVAEAGGIIGQLSV